MGEMIVGGMSVEIQNPEHVKSLIRDLRPEGRPIELGATFQRRSVTVLIPYGCPVIIFESGTY